MPGRFEGPEAAMESGMENGMAFAKYPSGLFKSRSVQLALEFQDGHGEVMALAGSAHQGLESKQKTVTDGGMDRRIQRTGRMEIKPEVPLSGCGLLRADQSGDPCGGGEVVAGELGGVDDGLETVFDGEDKLHDAHGVESRSEEVAFRVERFGGVEGFVS